MSILGNIFGAIFGSSASAAPAPTGGASAPVSPTSTATPASASAAQASPGVGQPSAQTSGTSAAAGSVDVEAILDKAVKTKGQKLEWRTSIVDLMKALDIDSSFAARKELAKDLHYTGDTNDSATMNIWLHKQVMTKLEENGGKVPADLKA